LEGEVERLQNGGVWSAVESERKRACELDAELADLRSTSATEIDELRTAAHGRSAETAARKQELKYLRHEVKELRAKNDSYDVRSQRKFFYVDPIMEDNQALRSRLDQAGVALNAERARADSLHAVVNPSTHSLFYQSRSMGGRETSEMFDMLSMALSAFMVSKDNHAEVIVAIARFFSINLPEEVRQSTFRNQIKKELKTRFAVPTAFTAKQKVELGGELADLATFEDLAESQSFGMTFDGCTLNMYSVFGGGVCILKQNGDIVRKMAFADMVGRETVANKMRKFQEFFARGRQCMELVQHPLAHQVCLERCEATNSDRGGADGCTGDAIKAKIVEIVVAKLGREEWRRASEDERDNAFLYVESEEACEYWERAAIVYADEELNKKHLDSEHVAAPFDDLSEMTQLLRVASYMLGSERYEAMGDDEKVVMVKLYCLEHALSNVLVTLGDGMATVARELIPAFIPEGSKVKAFVEVATLGGDMVILR
jgi:hypothetical protein